MTLSISANGIPAPEISWSKNGIDINFEESTHFLKNSDGSLVLPVVLPSDEGELSYPFAKSI